MIFLENILYFIKSITYKVKRLNKEIKLNVCDNMNLKYGSTNKDNPEIVYVLGKAWVSPKFNGDYESILNGIQNNFRKKIKNIVMESNIFENKFVLDFDLNSTNMEKDKKKFLSFDLFLKQDKNNVIKLKELNTIISNNIGNLANDLVYDFSINDFDVTKKKN